MDTDVFFRRPSLKSFPISLIARPARGSDLRGVVTGALALLKDRPQRFPADEVVLLTDAFPDGDFPARSNGVRIRVCVHSNPRSGPAFMAAVSACHNPAIVVVDDPSSLTQKELSALLNALELADFVSGRRRGATALWELPIRWAARRLLGVAPTDIFCPVKAFRRAALVDAILQTDGALLDIEIAAKMTFLTSLVDEVKLAAKPERISILAAVWRDRRRFLELLLRPRFWTVDGIPPRLRPSLSEPLEAVGARPPSTGSIEAIGAARRLKRQTLVGRGFGLRTHCLRPDGRFLCVHAISRH